MKAGLLQTLSVVRGLLISAAAVLSVTASANEDIPHDWKLVSRQAGYIFFEKAEPKAEFSYYRYKLSNPNQSTRSVAMEFMKNVRGRNLRPVPKVKGWEYSYVGNLPCATVVTKEEDYAVLINVCGSADTAEISRLIKISKTQFN